MDDYISFLHFGAVANVPNEEEFNKFAFLMKKLGLVNVVSTENSCKKYGFEKAFAYSGGIRQYENCDICFEFRSDGYFTVGSKQSYLDYDADMKILSVTDLANATGYENLFEDIDNNYEL